MGEKEERERVKEKAKSYFEENLVFVVPGLDFPDVCCVVLRESLYPSIIRKPA